MTLPFHHPIVDALAFVVSLVGTLMLQRFLARRKGESMKQNPLIPPFQSDVKPRQTAQTTPQEFYAGPGPDAIAILIKHNAAADTGYYFEIRTPTYTRTGWGPSLEEICKWIIKGRWAEPTEHPPLPQWKAWDEE